MVLLLRLLSVKSRLLSLLRRGARRGSGACGLARGETTSQSPTTAAQHLQRPPTQLRGILEAPSTRNCSPYTHVEPTTRRLGGRFRVAVLSYRRQERAVHRRLLAVAILYVSGAVELSWSFANDAQLLSFPPSSVSVRPSRRHSPRPHTYNSADRSIVSLPVLGIPASVAFGYVF
jgi:hypothetical protein